MWDTYKLTALSLQSDFVNWFQSLALFAFEIRLCFISLASLEVIIETGVAPNW